MTLVSYLQRQEQLEVRAENIMIKESCPGSREIKTPYPENIKCFWC